MMTKIRTIKQNNALNRGPNLDRDQNLAQNHHHPPNKRKRKMMRTKIGRKTANVIDLNHDQDLKIELNQSQSVDHVLIHALHRVHLQERDIDPPNHLKQNQGGQEEIDDVLDRDIEAIHPHHALHHGQEIEVNHVTKKEIVIVPLPDHHQDQGIEDVEEIEVGIETDHEGDIKTEERIEIKKKIGIVIGHHVDQGGEAGKEINHGHVQDHEANQKIDHEAGQEAKRRIANHIEIRTKTKIETETRNGIKIEGNTDHDQGLIQEMGINGRMMINAKEIHPEIEIVIQAEIEMININERINLMMREK